MTTQYSHYGNPNSPPVFSNLQPTTLFEPADVEVTFKINDLQDNIDLNTLDITLTHDPSGTPTVYEAMIDGVWQPGYGGTITDFGLGYDVVMNTHPDFAVGDWRCNLYVEDTVGEIAVAQWDWEVVIKPELINVRAIGRRTIEFEFDIPVRIRASNKLLFDPTDRYTPIDWVGSGGESYDAANPENYELGRASSGVFVGPGEAVELTAIYAEESSEQGYEDSGVIYSTHVEVTVDYQMTPRASYEGTASNLTQDGPLIDETTLGFTGFIVSQVERNTLTYFGSLAEHHRRIDREGTGDLQAFMSIWQEVMDRVLEDTDVFFWELCDIDRIRSDFLDNLLYDLGNPFAGMFDLTTTQKRKLVTTLVQIYREKGTCIGIINAVRFFVGINLSSCTNSWGTHWRLATGTAAAPESGLGGPYTLSDGPSSSPNPGSHTPCYAGPSTGYDIWSFRVVSPVTLTQDEKDKIEAIVEYMKPAASHYLGVIEP